MSTDSHATEPIDVAIITILSEEYEAVRVRLQEGRRDDGAKRPNTHSWLIGSVPSDMGAYKVVLALAGHAGNVSGFEATIQTLNRWHPRYVLLVGVAGGLGRDELTLGDVAISKHIAAYEHAKLQDGTIQVRPQSVQDPDGPLLRASVTLTGWAAGLGSKPDGTTTAPKMRIGMIGSGDKVVDDRTSDFFKAVERQFPKLIAVEMEGAGAAAAIKSANEAGANAGFLMIRGISDIPPSSRKGRRPNATAQTLQRDNWKQYASDVAAAFAIKLVATALPVPPRSLSANTGDQSVIPTSQTPPPPQASNSTIPAPCMEVVNPSISPEFETDFLEDPGMPLVHPDRTDVVLDDILVIPDLQEFEFVHAQRSDSIVSSTIIIDKVRAGAHQIFLLGDSLVGKTSLSKWLFRQCRNNGLVPVYLSGITKPILGKALQKAVSSAFVAQYEHNDKCRWDAIPKQLRVLIVDDLHLIVGRGKQRKEMQAELREMANSVVLLGNNLAMPMEDILARPAEPGFETVRYQILPLGHVKRSELIEKWTALGHDADDAQSARFIIDAKRLVDSIIGRNFVPAHPAYVLSLLQAQKTATAIDKGAGTHGYFYELLIRNALAHRASSEEYDMMKSYLVYVANAMMTRGVRDFTKSELLEVHKKFEDHVDVGLDFDWVFKRLCERNVFSVREDTVSFKYRFFFYYFAAVRIQDSLGLDETRERLRGLAATLHLEESANILLFLVHLTKDEFVIQLLLDAGQSVFEGETAATLVPGEYRNADMVLLESATEILLEGDPREERQRVLAEMDASQREKDLQLLQEASNTPNTQIARIAHALAALQLIGQVAKNFPGTLEASTKVDLLSACYGIGRRLIGWYIKFVTDNNLSVIAEVSREIQRDHPEFPIRTLVERAQKILAEIITLTCFGVIKHVSTSVGSRHLERTYKRLLDLEVPLIRLFDMSVKLDHANEFPLLELKTLGAELKDNTLSLIVLRGLVTQHFHTFPVAFQTKQSACDSLGMKYRRRDLPRANTKLLPPKA